MKFVMVTTSQDYWDRLAGNTGMFSEAVVQDSILEDLPKSPVNTIFIKKNPQTRKFERAWTGRAKNFKRATRLDRDYLTFEVESLKRYDCPEILRNKTVGCYILTDKLEEQVPAQPELHSKALKEPIATPAHEKKALEELEDIAIHEAPKFIPFSKRQNGYARDIVTPIAKDIPPITVEPLMQKKPNEDIHEPAAIQEHNITAFAATALQPAFFSTLLKTNSPAEFESNCFNLLRLLGIHDIHRPVNHTGNEAFGFFKFNTLSAIYSTTLMPAVVQENPMIIDHYFNLLRKEKIRFNNVAYSLKDTQKHIWLVTRSEQVEHIRTEDGIKLKLVPVRVLVDLYEERLNTDVLNLDGMWEKLKNL